MSRRTNQPKAQPATAQSAPTPEEVKALIDAQDWNWQTNLWFLLIKDPQSIIGGKVRTYLALREVRINRLEEVAGLAPGDVDPERLLSTKESLKEAKKRLGKKTVNAVKQAKHRAKERMAKLKSTMPAVTAADGRVIEVTEMQ
jgi:hypothetical protein